MKTIVLAFLLFTFSANAQYYYTDIIGTGETTELIKNYKKNKVVRVLLNSFDGDNVKSDDFYVEQIFSPDGKILKTVTRSGVTAASVLTSYINEDRVIKTIDSSQLSKSITTYDYTPDGLLKQIATSTANTNNASAETEVHQWEYADNRILKMIKIKDGKDTTFVSFKKDERGNIIEEQSTRKGLKQEPVYYYYDSKNRLTDMVRFHPKAKRLLPEYMFEYSPSNQVIQKITVPAAGSDYLIWRYQYNANGLKIKEAIYNKQKQLTGKIEYQYGFGL